MWTFIQLWTHNWPISLCKFPHSIKVDNNYVILMTLLVKSQSAQLIRSFDLLSRFALSVRSFLHSIESLFEVTILFLTSRKVEIIRSESKSSHDVLSSHRLFVTVRSLQNYSGLSNRLSCPEPRQVYLVSVLGPAEKTASYISCGLQLQLLTTFSSRTCQF